MSNNQQGESLLSAEHFIRATEACKEFGERMAAARLATIKAPAELGRSIKQLIEEWLEETKSKETK